MQVSALGDPDLLVAMSQTLTKEGCDTDRGHSSARLDALMSSRLNETQLDLYKSLCGRLDGIAAAAIAKVMLEPCCFQMLLPIQYQKIALSRLKLQMYKHFGKPNFLKRVMAIACAPQLVTAA